MIEHWPHLWIHRDKTKKIMSLVASVNINILYEKFIHWVWPELDMVLGQKKLILVYTNSW